MVRLVLATVLWMAVTSAFAGEFDIGVRRLSGACDGVTDIISREWFLMKDFFAVKGEKPSMRRPRSRDFQCISPWYVRNWVARGSTGVMALTCYTDPENPASKACCDRDMRSCATIRPPTR